MIVGSRHRPAGAQLQPYHRLTIVVRQRGDRLELAPLVHYAHAEMTDIGDPRRARRLEAAPFDQCGGGFESLVSPYMRLCRQTLSAARGSVYFDDDSSRKSADSEGHVESD